MKTSQPDLAMDAGQVIVPHVKIKNRPMCAFLPTHSSQLLHARHDARDGQQRAPHTFGI